jgi:cold shock CspA family protein
MRMSESQEQSPMTNGFYETPSRSVSPPDTVQPSPLSSASASSTVSAGNTEKSSRESSRLTGTVKWFNAKNGYGFITRNDTGEDVFVHFTGIARKNPRHAMKSLGDGEVVEFNIMGTNVTGLGGRPVRGNPYVSYIPVRRNDSFAAGDPVMFTTNRPRYIRGPMDFGNSRIPRWNPNWQPRQL